MIHRHLRPLDTRNNIARKRRHRHRRRRRRSSRRPLRRRLLLRRRKRHHYRRHHPHSRRRLCLARLCSRKSCRRYHHCLQPFAFRRHLRRQHPRKGIHHLRRRLARLQGRQRAETVHNPWGRSRRHRRPPRRLSRGRIMYRHPGERPKRHRQQIQECSDNSHRWCPRHHPRYSRQNRQRRRQRQLAFRPA